MPGKSHGQRSLVGCSPWGHKELDATELLHFHFSLSCIGEGNGNPLQCSRLENPRDGGAWWAAVYGVTQSWTLLKRLSSRPYSFPDFFVDWLSRFIQHILLICGSNCAGSLFIRRLFMRIANIPAIIVWCHDWLSVIYKANLGHCLFLQIKLYWNISAGFVYVLLLWQAFPGGWVVKESTGNAGATRDTGSIPGSGRSPGGGHGNPL